MSKFKVYEIFFTTKDPLTGCRRNVRKRCLGSNLKLVLSSLRSRGYTISRDYYYFVY